MALDHKLVPLLGHQSQLHYYQDFLHLLSRPFTTDISLIGQPDRASLDLGANRLSFRLLLPSSTHNHFCPRLCQQLEVVSSLLNVAFDSLSCIVLIGNKSLLVLHSEPMFFVDD